MARITKRLVLPLALCALVAAAGLDPFGFGAGPAGAAPSSASSRMRSFDGSIEVVVGADAEAYALDSIAVQAIRRGYAEVPGDRERLRLRFEKPATLEDVSALGQRYENTERRRLEFEVVQGSGNRLRVIGLLTLVTNPGATDETEHDVGKKQPFRDELKAIMTDVRRGLGRQVP